MPRTKKRPYSVKKTPIIIARAFQSFFSHSASGGIILLLCAIIAIIWINSDLTESYKSLLATNLAFKVNDFEFSEPLVLWINDGLMAIFFLAVGLEIKREFLVGELSSRKKAVLPLAAALGGMIFPALIYAAFNSQTEFHHGWGIPTATDIAFALGALALLGNRVPVGLKVFLAALAIADDLGAVLVIALFYSQGLALFFLAAAAVITLLLLAGNKLNIRSLWFYGILGIILWFLMFKSGIHATVAGVVLAFTIPARPRISAPAFASEAKAVIGEVDAENITTGQTQDAVQQLESLCDSVQTPLQQIEHGLQPFVSYLILPVFSLANAGIYLADTDIFAAYSNTVTLGIMLGLVFGKVIGVFSFTWISVKFGIAELPSGISMRNIFGVSWLCGIGFTMSLFVAGLAFGEHQIITNTKLGIFTASLLAGIIGFLVLLRQFTPQAKNLKPRISQ
ncbi:sodium/proton antiporter NhaA [Ignavibacteria bacterium]|nr:Na+/H+ antiporter NhaA [Bacteroidota bacterium]MCZ2132990.1 Na+/H+ antiporter NhaA [Bacteroidota bacterium]